MTSNGPKTGMERIQSLLLENKYASPSDLQNLARYKYHGCDHSIIANYIMQPFWNRAVNLLPLWMAPNMVTLIGFFTIIVSYLLLSFYCPNFEGTAPTWVYILCAANMFFYQTMDALDGKQARRTKTSSSLGELFDHGCDAVTTVLTALTVGTAVQSGPSIYTIALVFSCMTPFYLKQIEEYHTGEMILGYANVTEAQFITIFTFLGSAFFGPNVWLNTVNIFGFSIEYRVLALSIGYVGSFLTSLSSVYEIVRFHTSTSSVKTHDYQKRQTPLHITVQIAPIGFALIAGSIWAILSTDIVTINGHYFYLGWGLSIAGIVGKIVVARVCEQDFSGFQPILIFLPIGIINTFIQFISEKCLLQIFAISAVVAYGHLALSIIHDFCKFLKIKCLTIPHPPKSD